MGVIGLWQILESVGHPIKLEGLEGRRLGVDANLWLYKFIRGFREKDNAQSIDSHKLGLWNRICKLLFYKIKPVFVFDGPAPVLKRRTLERRQNLRSKQLTKVQDKAMELFAAQLKELYPNVDLDNVKITLPELTSNHLVAAEKLTDEDRELFKLPPPMIIEPDSDSDDDIEFETKKEEKETEPNLDQTVYLVDDSDDDDVKYTFDSRDPDYQPPVDIESDDFKTLPAEVRYEILKNIKESRRRIGRAQALPEDPNSFSKLQLDRLKSRRAVQEKIEQSERDICSLFTGYETGTNQTAQSYRVQSDSTSTMLYLRNNSYEPTPAVSQTSAVSESSSQKTEQKDSTMPQTPSAKDDIRITFSQPQRFAKKSSSELDPKPIILPLKFIKNASKLSIAPNETKLDDTVCLSDDDEDLSDQNPSLEASLNATSSSQNNKSDDQQSADESGETIEESVKEQPVIVEEDFTTDEESEFEETEKEGKKVNELEEELEGEVSKAQTNTSAASADLPPGLANSDDDIKFEKKKEETETTPNLNHTIYLVDDSDDDVKYTFDSRELDHQPPIDIESDDPQSAQPLLLQSDSTSNVLHIRNNAHEENEEEGKKIDEMEKELEKEMEKEVPRAPTIAPATSAALQASLDSRNEAKRVTNKVTTKIIEEAKELLRLFGVPYIDAAGEAEAQCALLEKLGLTQGTITDDSDVWLFGAQNVYRHFFSDDKYVTQYKMSDIDFHIRLNREALVCFAMLVGSDYTDGIMNVGPVTAIEILAEFKGDNMEPLIKFKNWKERYKKSKGQKPLSRKLELLLKFNLPEEFPSRAVFEGYMRPIADTSTEEFSWGIPDLDELREYARRNFGWDMKKIDEKLLPVIKKATERKSQPTIDSFFFKTAVNQNPELFRSKRVNAALNKISTKSNDEVLLSEEDDDDDDVERTAKTSSIQTKNKKAPKPKESKAKRTQPKSTAGRKRRKGVE